MALYNEILVGRFNNFMKKWLNMKGQAPAPQLAGEVSPSFTFFSGVENRWLEGWYRYMQAFDQPAVVGLTTAVRFRNPANSGMIAVIESMKLVSAAGQDFVIRQRDIQADINLGAVTQAAGIERREYIGTLPQRSAINTSVDLAGSQLGVAVALYILPAGGPPLELILQDNQEWVVDPGQWFQFIGNLANTRWTLTIGWRERPLEPSEVI